MVFALNKSTIVFSMNKIKATIRIMATRRHPRSHSAPVPGCA